MSALFSTSKSNHWVNVYDTVNAPKQTVDITTFSSNTYNTKVVGGNETYKIDIVYPKRSASPPVLTEDQYKQLVNIMRRGFYKTHELGNAITNTTKDSNGNDILDINGDPVTYNMDAITMGICVLRLEFTDATITDADINGPTIKTQYSVTYKTGDDVDDVVDDVGDVVLPGIINGINTLGSSPKTINTNGSLSVTDPVSLKRETCQIEFRDRGGLAEVFKDDTDQPKLDGIKQDLHTVIRSYWWNEITGNGEIKQTLKNINMMVLCKIAKISGDLNGNGIMNSSFEITAVANDKVYTDGLDAYNAALLAYNGSIDAYDAALLDFYRNNNDNPDTSLDTLITAALVISGYNDNTYVPSTSVPGGDLEGASPALVGTAAALSALATSVNTFAGNALASNGTGTVTAQMKTDADTNATNASAYVDEALIRSAAVYARGDVRTIDKFNVVDTNTSDGNQG